jgi:HEPN domain-containing protein
VRVTDAQLVKHWRHGAKQSLRLATLTAEDGLYELALFHCHLAVEKALKAAIMEQSGEPHPKVHALLRLGMLVHDDWSADERELFDALSEFAVAARYDDPDWAKRSATASAAHTWIKRTTTFLSQHLR